MSDFEARLYDQLAVFVSRRKICRSARVYHDLMINGDDAGEFLDAYVNAFQIDLTGFEFETFFPNETDEPWEHWGMLLGFPNKRKELTVAHLQLVAESQRWFDPPEATGKTV